MRHTLALAALALGACYQAPDLPLLDEIPVVGQPVSSCDSERDEQVVCVVDGDTFDLSACGEGLGERVRMLGINAPEIAHSDSEESECWGDEAQEELTEILTGREVTLTFDQTCLDIYGRTLAYVWLVGDEIDPLRDEDGIEDFLGYLHAGDEEDALLVNEWVTWNGFARVFDEDIFGRLIHQDRLDAAQASAEQNDRGLWGDCEGTSGTAPATSGGG